MMEVVNKTPLTFLVANEEDLKSLSKMKITLMKSARLSMLIKIKEVT